MGSIKTEDLRQRGHIAIVTQAVFEASTSRYFQAFSTILLKTKIIVAQKRIHSPWITVGFDSWNSSNLDGSRLVPFSMEE